MLFFVADKGGDSSFMANEFEASGVCTFNRTESNLTVPETSFADMAAIIHYCHRVVESSNAAVNHVNGVFPLASIKLRFFVTSKTEGSLWVRVMSFRDPHK